MMRSRSMATLFGVLLGASVLCAVACSGSSSAPAVSTTAETESDAADSSSEEKVAPAFELEDLEGKLVSLADFDGQVRLIDFWATWCAPCREEIPMLNELHASYSDQGFQILAISDESVDLIREFVEEHGVIYTNLVGTGEVFEEYGALGLPTAYLVDREGRIVDFFFGPKPKRQLEKKIRALLES